MKIFPALILLTLILSFASYAQTKEKPNRSEFVNAMLEERKLKDAEMISDEHSPIPAEEKAGFKNLHYYRPDAKFRKEVTFERFDQATHFLMKTTTERLPEYSIYGVVRFRHKNKTYSLNVYQNIELVKKPGYEKHLFIPFNDLTNGKETYGGGRFLDITETGADKLIVDFNKAYNPYCAYNHKYSCPVPPEANDLKIKIKAGEKKWHK